MSGGNGHEPTGVPVAVSLMPSPTRVRPRSVADLSSVERSKLLDALVAQAADIVNKHNAMVKSVGADIDALLRDVKEHRAILDAHAGVVNRITFWGRLRWLVLGV